MLFQLILESIDLLLEQLGVVHGIVEHVLLQVVLVELLLTAGDFALVDPSV